MEGTYRHLGPDGPGRRARSPEWCPLLPPAERFPLAGQERRRRRAPGGSGRLGRLDQEAGPGRGHRRGWRRAGSPVCWNQAGRLRPVRPPVWWQRAGTGAEGAGGHGRGPPPLGIMVAAGHGSGRVAKLEGGVHTADDWATAEMAASSWRKSACPGRATAHHSAGQKRRLAGSPSPNIAVVAPIAVVHSKRPVLHRSSVFHPTGAQA